MISWKCIKKDPPDCRNDIMSPDWEVEHLLGWNKSRGTFIMWWRPKGVSRVRPTHWSEMNNP